MPPSPALRCSPGRETTRANNHKHGQSFESGLFFREKDEDLALFSEMQTRERDNFLLQSSDDLDAMFSSKLRHFSDIKYGISIPARGESSDMLNVDGEKNDYDWLLTPPDTPLFPSLDDEPTQYNSTRRGRPRSQPISISRSSTLEKNYRSSRGSASPNRLSPSPRSGSSTLQSRGRPSSARQLSPSPILRQATPTRRPTTPPSKTSTPVQGSSTPTPRRMSTGGAVTSSGIRGVSPVKTSRGNSASPKISAWQANIPGLSGDAPPNLRTSLADRPATYVRGSSPASRNGRRQSMSPTASRSVSSSHSHEKDPFSSHSKGSVASSGDDDVDSIQSILVGSLDRPTSRGFATFSNNRALGHSKKAKTPSPSSAPPKRSFDSAIRQMDQRKTPQNMFRPLLSSVPSTTFYVGKTSSTHHPLISRNSSVTTSSNTSSDHGTSAAHDAEFDHNRDTVATEFEKVPFMEVPGEVFAFDKMDIVDEDVGHEIRDKATDVSSSDFDRASKIEFGIAEPGESFQSGDVAEMHHTSESSLVNDDFSEVDSFENRVVCSRCGCRYLAILQEEQDTRLCPECSARQKLMRGNMSLASSSTITLEGKPSDGLVSVMSIPVSPHVTGVSDQKNLQAVTATEEKTSYSEQSDNYSRDNSTVWSEAKGIEDRFAHQKEEVPAGSSQDLPGNDSGGSKLHHSSMKVDISEGTGISVLLKRTSSSKGYVVQGRTFSAASIPYDDLSYSKDSVSSLRSSVGHGSFSTSSSVDFSSMQSDSRVQRQLSGKKLEIEYYRSDKAARPPSTGSSFSGISSLTNQAVSLSRSTQEDSFQASIGNTEHDAARDIIVASRERLLASEHTEADDTFVAEDEYDRKDHRSRNPSTPELAQISDVHSGFENSVESPPAVENEEYPKETCSRTEPEAPDITQKFLSDQDAVVNVDEVYGEPRDVHHSSVVTTSEIEMEDRHSPSDNISLASKSTAEDYPEASPSDKDMIASTPEDSGAHDHANDELEQETTVMVESQNGRRTKSLTLEEATDTILFCRTIVHDLAYQAATIAMEKETPDPFEGSQPRVTILGKSNHERRDPPRSRAFSNRSSKPQKMTQKKRVETDAKPLDCTDENDENAIEPLQRNVRSPMKLDSLKPPKLESKCNCTIM